MGSPTDLYCDAKSGFRERVLDVGDSEEPGHAIAADCATSRGGGGGGGYFQRVFSDE